MLGREVVIVEAVRKRPRRPWASRQGPVQGRPPERAPRDGALGGDRPLGDRAGGGRRRDHRLRDGLRRAVGQRRPKRVAASGLPIETPATTIDQAMRLGPASGQLRHRARRVRRARRSHRVAASNTWATSRCRRSARSREQSGQPFPPALLERHNLVPQGLSAELIAETWGISREECDAFALPRNAAQRGLSPKAASTARSSRLRSTARRSRPTRDPPRHVARGPGGAEARVQRRRHTAAQLLWVSDGAAAGAPREPRHGRGARPSRPG